MSSSDRIFSTSGRGRLYNSITETVGDTPVVKLHRIAPDHVNMYVKVEAFNPAASVNQNELWQGVALVLHAFVPAVDHLFHRRKIVRAFHGFHVEMACPPDATTSLQRL